MKILQSRLILTYVCLGGALLVHNRSLGASPKDSTSPAHRSTTLPEAFLAHTTPGAGAPTPAKLCSAVHHLSFNWRDTVMVPDNWKAPTCQNLANSLGATQYQLGCANSGSFSWGNRQGSLPADNQCGW